jgi:mycothiol system anti-sigma-R factor
MDRYTCEETFRRLDDYLDRELPAAETERVQRHLETCAWCAREFRFEASVLSQVREKVGRLSAPPDLMARVSLALQQEESGGPD